MGDTSRIARLREKSPVIKLNVSFVEMAKVFNTPNLASSLPEVDRVSVRPVVFWDNFRISAPIYNIPSRHPPLSFWQMRISKRIKRGMDEAAPAPGWTEGMRMFQVTLHTPYPRKFDVPSILLGAWVTNVSSYYSVLMAYSMWQYMCIFPIGILRLFSICHPPPSTSAEPVLWKWNVLVPNLWHPRHAWEVLRSPALERGSSPCSHLTNPQAMYNDDVAAACEPNSWGNSSNEPGSQRGFYRNQGLQLTISRTVCNAQRINKKVLNAQLEIQTQCFHKTAYIADHDEFDDQRIKFLYSNRLWNWPLCYVRVCVHTHAAASAAVSGDIKPFNERTNPLDRRAAGAENQGTNERTSAAAVVVVAICVCVLKAVSSGGGAEVKLPHSRGVGLRRYRVTPII